MSETQTELSLVEKAQIINAFWNAPDDATFPPDVTAVVIDSTPGSLTTMRSTGCGPEFMSAGKKILYRKRAIRKWQESNMVEAQNSAHARELLQGRQ